MLVPRFISSRARIDLHDPRGMRLIEFSSPAWQTTLQRNRSGNSVPVKGLGGDISKWNPEVDWVKYCEKLEYVIVRAGYGLTEDTKFSTHWAGAKSVPIKKSVYWYYLDGVDPKLQARKFYEVYLLRGGEADFPPVLDIEGTNNPTLTASKILACCLEIELLFGVKPILYTGYYIWRDLVQGNKAWASAYMLWIASYPLAGWEENYPEIVVNYPPLIPYPWTSFVIWQWIPSAPGIDYGVGSTYLDLDYASPEFYAKYLASDPPVPPPPPGDDEMTEDVKCVVQATHLNLRATATSSGVDSGNFNTGTYGKFFPAFTNVKKSTLPNKEIWWLIMLPDGTVGWAAEWHPSIVYPDGPSKGKQYAALIKV